MKKIGINGLGRIGRLVLRHYMANPSNDVDIVAANDLTPIDDLAYLIRFDSVHGKVPYDIGFGSDYIQLSSKKIKILNERDPTKIPWKKLGVDIVLECTGLFRRREDAAKHISAGASKVIISAPSESADLTIVQGVNEDLYDPKKHHVISNASCTTNSLAPVVKVLNDTFGIEHLLVTTVHAYTASQGLVDRSARKIRRGRAAALSIIPTTTGAAKATGLVLPKLQNKMDALAIRVPIPDGALTDIVAELKSNATVEEVNEVFRIASMGDLKGVLGYSEDEIVSADIIGDTNSGIVDGTSTKVVDNKMVKVLVWYDNEFGYAKKLLELAEYISKMS
ncbi:MAG: type I glyceraldehyde-3-phosphate dehydrogenase [Thermoplasmata archaeon M9B1D]|nr:MAG: type I glyceraldehyde-3-phosphate dehydrogenase [Thermoplasmata archaeon M9B1D]PNX51435.1 MAG: type I glyceraldehyde-3-phosphate dehydrogenase [Thermoplasmata archaeon M8B2D]